ncbi:MAG: serine/threonine-protein kinase [Myxococcota bacterium]
MAWDAFAAEELIGSGAMGQVWRGRHVRSGTPVAIKLVLPQRVRASIAAEAVRREARAVAGLAHPNVVWVYDQGEVGAEMARTTNVPRGTPFLVMEHLSGGDLAQRHRRPSWRAVREDLLAILHALAHCHARGVVHRDLKPGNVLFGDRHDARAGLKLTDFGISATADQHTGSYGTPQYCAPEQHGDGAPLGPWTDVYAVGALGWRLLTGVTPFVRWRGAGVYLAKADEQLPRFEPVCPVPHDIESWLRCCMAAAVGSRFQCAPDAAFALEALGRPHTRGPASRRRASDDDGLTTLLHPGRPTAPVRAAPPPAPWDAHRPGALWEQPVPPPALRDAGLGLWEHRPTPLFAPGPQRTELVDAFFEAVRTGGPVSVCLHGDAGTGRTRLARWIGEALAERCGVAAWFVPAGEDAPSHVLSSTVGSPRQALDWLALRGLDSRAVHDAVQRWTTGTGEAGATAAAVVRAIARQRPAVLVIDDAPGSVPLVDDLLDGPRVPVLVVRVGLRPVAGARALTRIDPLPPEPMAQMLGETLPLDAEAVRAVAEASGGRPGRALALLHESAALGRWTLGTHGIAVDLEGPERAPLDLPAPIRTVLERIAVRGVRTAVPAALVASEAGDTARDALRQAESLGLVDLSDGSVAFRPGVRRALLDTCADRASHHRAWVRHLPISPDRAWHRLRSGDLDGGMAELAAVLEDPATRVGLAVVVAHAERALALWTRCDRAPSAGPWATVTLWRAVGRLSLGDGLATVREDLARARRAGLRALEARLLLLEAEHLGIDDEPTLRAIHDLVADGDPGTRAIVERALRLAAGRAEDWEAWEHWLATCRTTAHRSADPRIQDLLHELEADAAAWEGRWVDAYAHIRRCDDLHPGYTDTRCALFALAAGALPEARLHARRGVEQSAERQDRRHLPWALLADALVHALAGEPESARRRLEDARRSTAEHAGRWGASEARFGLATFAVAVAEGSARRALAALETLETPRNPSPQHHAVLAWAESRTSSSALAEAARAARLRVPGRRRPADARR